METDESYEELHGDKRPGRNIIRVEVFGNTDNAGHNSEILKSLAGNIHSSGYDFKKHRYRPIETFNQKFEEGSSSE